MSELKLKWPKVQDSSGMFVFLLTAPNSESQLCSSVKLKYVQFASEIPVSAIVRANINLPAGPTVTVVREGSIWCCMSEETITFVLLMTLRPEFMNKIIKMMITRREQNPPVAVLQSASPLYRRNCWAENRSTDASPECMPLIAFICYKINKLSSLEIIVYQYLFLQTYHSHHPGFGQALYFLCILTIYTQFDVNNLKRYQYYSGVKSSTFTMKKAHFFVIIWSLFALAACSQNLTTEESWIYGFLVGLGISLLGFGAALFLVCIKSMISPDSFLYFVNLLYSLGCGAIIGDAIIHILPDAYKDKEADSKIVSLIFICAVLFFLIIERLFESLGIVHHHWGEGEHHHGHEHDHGHEHEHECTDSPAAVQRKQQELRQVDDDGHNEVEQISFEGLKGKKPAGYLNLLSSFIHNFFDGFAIGVGFATKDPHVYIPVMIAIIAHEIPREMGDVGILMKSGFTSFQTVMCNGLVNFMSLAGLFPGLALGGISSGAQNYIMTFVAGNFIYVGADIWRNLLRNRVWYENLIELAMFFLGVGAMFAVLFLEESGGE